MSLAFCTDLSAADWIARSDLAWPRLVTFGPAGFEAYARLRFLPDPVRTGQRENDAAGEDRPDPSPVLFEVLAAFTSTPDDCHFCVWEGYGDTVTVNTVSAGDGAVYLDDEDALRTLGSPDARPALAPAPVSSMPPLPRVAVPERAYWLFRGPLADLGAWDSAHGWPDGVRLHGVEPAFVWPADHAWCVASDVDPHWAGIGGSRSLVDRLVTDPRLDVVPADPAQEQPRYTG